MNQELERYRHIIEQQRLLLDQFVNSDRRDSRVAINELTAKFKQIVDSSNAIPSTMSTKVTLPKQQSQVSSPTSTGFSDPFGLPASAANTVVHSFGSNNDPFGPARVDDPFASNSTSTIQQDATDPFRPVDFHGTHELIKKTMANRSKTPGANMFGGSNYDTSATTTSAAAAMAPPPNRPQSAMPWEPNREPPPQPGTQAFHDLFDVFG